MILCSAYYNEIDPKAAAWLRELIAEGLIADGVVDERDIREVQASELSGFNRCHFFAWIGGWDFALRLAGWPDDVPVWTGSCPCQGLSSAGKGLGAQDERHLWPEFLRLIRECRPPVVFGEQVASGLGLGWLAGVRADLEESGYAVGAADLCAAGVGAPHIRQRLYWVANVTGWFTSNGNVQRGWKHGQRKKYCFIGGLGDAECTESRMRNGQVPQTGLRRDRPAITGDACGLEHAEGGGAQPTKQCGCECGPESSGKNGWIGNASRTGPQIRQGPEVGHGAVRNEWSAPAEANPWRASVWWPLSDGTWRRIAGRPDQSARGVGSVPASAGGPSLYVEPALFPISHGLPGRVGLLRGAGNAIVPQVAAAFIRAYGESWNVNES